MTFDWPRTTRNSLPRPFGPFSSYGLSTVRQAPVNNFHGETRQNLTNVTMANLMGPLDRSVSGAVVSIRFRFCPSPIRALCEICGRYLRSDRSVIAVESVHSEGIVRPQNEEQEPYRAVMTHFRADEAFRKSVVITVFSRATSDCTFV